MMSSSIKQHIVTAPNVSKSLERDKGTGSRGIDTFPFILFLHKKINKIFVNGEHKEEKKVDRHTEVFFGFGALISAACGCTESLWSPNLVYRTWKN